MVYISYKRGWLKAMYIYTIIGAGAFGLGIVLLPDLMCNIFGWPSQDPVVFGITGSAYTAFAILSILGLRSPLKYSPILLLQLAYKSIWMAGVILPLYFSGRLPGYDILYVVIYATYIIGDLIAIPFGYVFARAE